MVVLERVWRTLWVAACFSTASSWRQQKSIGGSCSRMEAACDTKTPSAARARPPPGKQPGQDASRSRWSGTRATNRPTHFPSHHRRPPVFELPAAAEAGGRRGSINKSVSHRWPTRTDVETMSLVCRSLMTRTVTSL